MAISDPDELAQWLGTSVELDLRPGGRGRVVDDDGTVRDVARHRRRRANGIAWHWWSDDGELSSVELRLDEHDGHARLHIVETVVPGRSPGADRDAPHVARCSRRWTAATSRLWHHVGAAASHERRHRAGRSMRERCSPPSPIRRAAMCWRRSPRAPGTATATELAAELPVTRQAIAKHLACSPTPASSPRSVTAARPATACRRLPAPGRRLDRPHRGELGATGRSTPAAPRRALTGSALDLCAPRP